MDVILYCQLWTCIGGNFEGAAKKVEYNRVMIEGKEGTGRKHWLLFRLLIVLAGRECSRLYFIRTWEFVITNTFPYSLFEVRNSSWHQAGLAILRPCLATLHILEATTAQSRFTPTPTVHLASWAPFLAASVSQFRNKSQSVSVCC